MLSAEWRVPIGVILATALAVLPATACSSANEPSQTNAGATAATATGAPGASPTGDAAATPSGLVRLNDFAQAEFSDPTAIDNEWLPFAPGTRNVFKGQALDDGEPIRRMVVSVDTELTKEIAGIQTRVVLELDYNDGELVERDVLFFAQDDAGNVWQLGEFPAELEGGKVVKTPIWIHGIRGARAGAAMQAEPAVGTPSYAAGWGPDVGWNDRAKIFATDARTCVPVDCYTNVLIVREYNPDEPGASQLKFYASGVGNVRVGWRGPKEEEREELVLVRTESLDASELAQVHKDVLKQDREGFEVSPKVYGTTSPIEAAAPGA